jgi:hypothetical protein
MQNGVSGMIRKVQKFHLEFSAVYEQGVIPLGHYTS